MTGYQTLAWINGGLDTAGGGALPTKNGKDVRYGGIGGVSQVALRLLSHSRTHSTPPASHQQLCESRHL